MQTFKCPKCNDVRDGEFKPGLKCGGCLMERVEFVDFELSTCRICGNVGEHDTAAHYQCTSGADRPSTIRKFQSRIEAQHGTAPKLAEIMTIFGVEKRQPRS